MITISITNTHNLLSRFPADIASALNLMKKGITHDHTIHNCKNATPTKPRILNRGPIIRVLVTAARV